MIPILLIHDLQRNDRRELFTKELDEQGIETWELVPAVKDVGTPTENIAQAHKNCIRRAMERDLPSVVIMEDDVRFVAPGAYNRFLELSFTLPEGWDILTGGSYEYRKLGQYNENLLRIGPFSGLHCYMVHKKFYQKYLDLAPGRKNIDKSIEGVIYMTVPMLALQHDTYSDNVKKVTNYNKTLHQKVQLWKKTK